MTRLQSLDIPSWLRAWQDLPADRREVYAHPAYAQACAAWEGARPACLMAASSGVGGQMLYPYLIHPIEQGADAGNCNASICDVQTAYGYGGPVFGGNWPSEEKKSVFVKVGEIFRSCGAIAEFVRCHTEWVDPAALGSAGYKVFQVRTNVECDLAATQDYTATWAAGARRNLRRAQSAGLTYRPGSTPADWTTFESLYAATAARLDMAAHYRFDSAYFAALATIPGVRLVLVEFEGRAVAAAVVFGGGRLAHYHLGASDFAYADRRPNDYLYYAMAQTARAAGCDRIVWGGGMSNDPDDTLFRFKAHFGALRQPAYCAGRIIDVARYEDLCARWVKRNPGRTSPLFLRYRA